MTQSPKYELFFFFLVSRIRNSMISNIRHKDQAKYVEEINIKCKKVSENQYVLRNAIRIKLFNHPFPAAPNLI